jgi:hypothetical protein
MQRQSFSAFLHDRRSHLFGASRLIAIREHHITALLGEGQRRFSSNTTRSARDKRH